MNEFDAKYNIVNEITPFNTPLTAHYKRSFAHYTLKDRLPIILTKVIDQLSQDKDIIAEEYGGESIKDEIKDIVGNISKLKYQLQTDKQFQTFQGNEPDKNEWNEFLKTLTEENNSYFTTTWLYSECYMYRRLKSFFENSQYLQSFDYFRKQKENALITSKESMTTVLQHINKMYKDNETKPKSELCEYFIKIIKLNLWGNRADLSISAGTEIKHIKDPFLAIESYDTCILVNKSMDIWNCILSAASSSSSSSENIIIDIIQDNSGYELFTDFILADFLLENKLATKIRFHVKAIPWFVSDVTKHDFHWTLETLRTCTDNEIISNFGIKLLNYLKLKQFELCEIDYFWTGPYAFDRMADVQPKLYEQLSIAQLLIFKGDLNYRKLLGDYNWPYDTDFNTTLRKFHPTNLCTLRTIKADLICGLENGVAEKLNESEPMWMETGKYGVIQFSNKI